MSSSSSGGQLEHEPQEWTSIPFHPLLLEVFFCFVSCVNNIRRNALSKRALQELINMNPWSQLFKNYL